MDAVVLEASTGLRGNLSNCCLKMVGEEIAINLHNLFD